MTWLSWQESPATAMFTMSTTDIAELLTRLGKAAVAASAHWPWSQPATKNEVASLPCRGRESGRGALNPRRPMPETGRGGRQRRWRSASWTGCASMINVEAIARSIEDRRAGRSGGTVVGPSGTAERRALQRVRVPLASSGIIYESRPNVTAMPVPLSEISNAVILPAAARAVGRTSHP